MKSCFISLLFQVDGWQMALSAAKRKGLHDWLSQTIVSSVIIWIEKKESYPPECWLSGPTQCHSLPLQSQPRTIRAVLHSLSRGPFPHCEIIESDIATFSWGKPCGYFPRGRESVGLLWGPQMQWIAWVSRQKQRKHAYFSAPHPPKVSTAKGDGILTMHDIWWGGGGLVK